jgi:hypothetical protein
MIGPTARKGFIKLVYIDRPLQLQLHAALARALINLSVLLCAMASYETAYGGSIAVNRSINGFDISWCKDRIEVRRDRFPKHGYEFETSPDRWSIKRLVSTSPVDVNGADPVLDAERYKGAGAGCCY